MNFQKSPRKRRFLKSVISMLLLAMTVLSCQVPCYAASAARVVGNADVHISACSVVHSPGTDASIETPENSCVIMKADLLIPGDWACFNFTVKNTGNTDVVLSDVIQSDQTPENIQVSFGIGDRDIGEKLKTGEQCQVSIVAQLDPEKKDDISETGEFGLTMIYESEEISEICKNDSRNSIDEKSNKTESAVVSPKTGDDWRPFPVLCMILFTAGWIFLLEKRRHRSRI